MSTGRDELLMAVVDYNLEHPEFDELSDIGDGQHLCSVAADLIHELRRELYETQDQIVELEAQLAEEKAARERAEKLLEGANKSRKSLAYMLRKVRSAKKQRIEQLEAESERLLALLKVATCPACDGSGAIPHGPLCDGSWEAEQCQWCDERKQALAQTRGPDEPESLPLMARETAERLDGPSAEIGNHYATVNGKVYRIADTDEHGLPVVMREPGMDPWAKYVHRSSGWISCYRDLPARSDKTGFQRIEDYNEQE